MDWPEVKQWRRERRAELIARRMAVPAATRRAWGAVIEQAIAELIASSKRQTIGFYWPFKAEFDPRPLVRRLISDGLRAALPAVIEKKAPMEFRLWTPESEMEDGIWNIPVPKRRDVVVPDLVLAPVVGFDAESYRLGYGGGYFDRTLAVLAPRPMAVGVGFELGRLATVYPQAHDIPMNAVATEAGLQRR
jgi:5-formyltetrahydrofolate cyclo-ligase